MKIAIRVLLGVAAVALVWWISSLMTFTEVKVPMALRGEAARNPFYAAIRLVEELDGSASWERVFTMPPEDAVVYLSAWNWTLGKARRERLEDWVEAGGRLIVDNSMVGGSGEFERWSGIGRQEVAANDDPGEEEEEDEEDFTQLSDAEAETRWRERLCRPLVEDGSQQGFKVCGIDLSHTLIGTRKATWTLRDGRDIHAIRTAVGRGSVTVINAAPFRHRSFLEGDHAALFVQLLQLRRGDTVMFLTEGEADSLLRLLWRYGAPAVLLMAVFVALALWRAGARFGPPLPATIPARRSLGEQIRGTGQFALRFGGGRALHRASLRALRDAAVRRFPAYDHMDSESRVTAIAGAAGMSADELGPAMNYSGARTRHELRDAIAVLETARRILSAQKEKHGKH